jgi:hypothetical protein
MEPTPRQLEIQITALTGDVKGHIALCEGRWRVMRLATGALSAIIALAVSVAVAFLTRS